MARSRNTQKKYKSKKFWDEYFKTRKGASPYTAKQDAPHEMMFDFDKNPNWWDHLHTTEKNRRKERDILKAIEKGNLEADIRLGPYKKPKIWYW